MLLLHGMVSKISAPLHHCDGVECSKHTPERRMHHVQEVVLAGEEFDVREEARRNSARVGGEKLQVSQEN